MDAGGSIGSMSSAQPSLAEMEAPLQMGQAGPGGGMPSPKQNVMIAHCAFKFLALLVYLGSGFSSNYVTTFVMVTVLSALDFWTVKNITGRLLVGLRWCNFIDEAGKSHWHFLSFEDQRVIHPTDSNVFWVALFLAPCIWVLIAITTVLTLRFMWLVLVLVALGLTSMNTLGYVKCKRDAGRKLSALGGTVLTKGFEVWSKAGGAARFTGRERVATQDPV